MIENIDQHDGSYILELFKVTNKDHRHSGYVPLFLNIDADGYSFIPVSIDNFEHIKSIAPRYFRGVDELK